MNRAANQNNAGKGSTLAARLKLSQKDKDFSPLPGPLLRKYVAYAKQYVFPRFFIGSLINLDSNSVPLCNVFPWGS